LDITQDKAVLIGRELRQLTKSDSFEFVVEVIRENYSQELFHTAAHQQENRELVYQESLAFKRLLSTINSFIMIYEQDALSPEVEDDDDYYNQ
jgi:hypothetical protein